MAPLSHVYPPALLLGSPFISSPCPYIQTSFTDTRLQVAGFLSQPRGQLPQLYSSETGEYQACYCNYLHAHRSLCTSNMLHQYKCLHYQEQNNLECSNTEILGPGFSSATITSTAKASLLPAPIS